MKLGILGGGQLARMLALSAYPLNIDTICLDPSAEACANAVTEVVCAEYDDWVRLQPFVEQVDVVTYETENIPISCAKWLSQRAVLFPSVDILEIAQDRLLEKKYLNALGIPTADFLVIDSCDELRAAVDRLGLPAILKTRRFGYDGKGQWMLQSLQDLEVAWNELKHHALIVEKFVDFDFEVSLIASRNQSGEIRYYPMTQNQHKNSILHVSTAPFSDVNLQQQAEMQLKNILERMNYVGTLTVEYFIAKGQLIANEIAPRVHNSGHWTIEGAQTSQFENHVRACMSLPLGSTAVNGHCMMLNCVGSLLPIKPCLEIPGLHYHDYGKSPRVSRKLGHVTLVDNDKTRFNYNCKRLKALSEQS